MPPTYPRSGTSHTMHRAIAVTSNERLCGSNHQQLDCLLNNLCRLTSKKIPKLASLAFWSGSHCWPLDSPHKGSVTQKEFHVMTSSREYAHGSSFIVFCCGLSWQMNHKKIFIWFASAESRVLSLQHKGYVACWMRTQLIWSVPFVSTWEAHALFGLAAFTQLIRWFLEYWL